MTMDAPSLAAVLAQASAFTGDSADSFREICSLFARFAPGAHLSYVLMQPSPRLAAACHADGRILHALTDPLDSEGTLLRLDDLLSLHLLSECTLAWISPSRLESSGELFELLGQPQRVLRVPVYRAGTALHVALFGFPAQSNWAAVDAQTVLLLANAVIAMVSSRIRVAALESRGAKVLAEVHDLIDVQRALLPDAPLIRGLRYAIHYQPSALAGGDYYDLMSLAAAITADGIAADIAGCMIADVSGHGAGAAMETVQFDAILRTYQGDESSGPASALSYANRYFFSRRPRGHFMTVLALLLDPAKALLTFCSAGHPPFLRWREGQISEHGRQGDPPLGILRDYQFQDQQLPLEAGDLFVLLTDGIHEARDATGAEFGLPRVRELLDTYAALGPVAVRDALVSSLQLHQGGPIGRDDQTLVVLQWAPQAAD